jgi:hypothetical protein
MSIELVSKIPQYIEALESTILETLKEAANDLLTDAKANCPVRTGFLRDSGEMEAIIEAGIAKARISFTAEYFKYVEAKQHFLYSAYIRHEQRVAAAIAEAIRRI